MWMERWEEFSTPPHNRGSVGGGGDGPAVPTVAELDALMRASINRGGVVKDGNAAVDAIDQTLDGGVGDGASDGGVEHTYSVAAAGESDRAGQAKLLAMATRVQQTVINRSSSTLPLGTPNTVASAMTPASVPPPKPVRRRTTSIADAGSEEPSPSPPVRCVLKKGDDLRRKDSAQWVREIRFNMLDHQLPTKSAAACGDGDGGSKNGSGRAVGASARECTGALGEGGPSGSESGNAQHLLSSSKSNLREQKVLFTAHAHTSEGDVVKVASQEPPNLSSALAFTISMSRKKLAAGIITQVSRFRSTVYLVVLPYSFESNAKEIVAADQLISLCMALKPHMISDTRLDSGRMRAHRAEGQRSRCSACVTSPLVSSCFLSVWRLTRIPT
jgi:hypothetical protein